MAIPRYHGEPPEGKEIMAWLLGFCVAITLAMSILEYQIWLNLDQANEKLAAQHRRIVELEELLKSTAELLKK